MLSSADETGIFGTILFGIDEAKCGVHRAEIVKWWTDHQAEDAKRLALEEAKQSAERLKREALAKLSPEERAALGLKD